MTTTDFVAAAAAESVDHARIALRNHSVQQLREELAQALTMTAQHLVRLAAVWAELESRGEDLSDLRTGLSVYLPRIADGRLNAEAVIRFAGQPTVLRSVAALPLARQQALARGELVPVLVVDEKGSYSTEPMPVYALTAAQARMVFDGDKIRSETEQRATLESMRVRRVSRTRPGPQNRVRYDSKADLLRIGRSSATVGEVTAALAQAEQSDDASLDSSPDIQVMAKLTESEHRMLKIRASEAGMSLQEYMRAALKRACLL